MRLVSWVFLSLFCLVFASCRVGLLIVSAVSLRAFLRVFPVPTLVGLPCRIP